MPNPAPNNPARYKQFLWSPHHAWLAALTLGLGFISAHIGLLMVGVAAYALGWIYLPDSALFTRWIENKEHAVEQQNSQLQAQAFIARRDGLIASLSPERVQRYYDVAAVCRDIENATRESETAAPPDSTDPRLRKLDELMWTYLRLLVMESSLSEFLETERQEALPEAIASGQQEIARMDDEIKAVLAKNENATAKLRLLESRKERLAALEKRQNRVQEATDNIALVSAEQDRLVQQIKLLRADSVAARNAETLTARIDATVEHLSQTNKLFSEIDQFKDLVSEDLPVTSERLGYAPQAESPATPPPVLPAASRGRVNQWH
jgi:hypothetical protein